MASNFFLSYKQGELALAVKALTSLPKTQTVQILCDRSAWSSDFEPYRPYPSLDFIESICLEEHEDLFKTLIHHIGRETILKSYEIMELAKHCAIILSHNGNLSTLKFLLEIPCINDLTDVFENACRFGYTEMVKFLLSHNINDSAKENGLSSACHSGKIDIIKLLAPKDPIVLYRELNNACRTGHIEIVDLLISMGADPILNINILSAICRFGRFDILQRFKLDISKSLANYVFIDACDGGNIEIIKLLLSKGADKLCDGIHMASRECNLEVFNFLLDNGATEYNKYLYDIRGLKTGRIVLRGNCPAVIDTMVSILITKLGYIPKHEVYISEEQLYYFYKTGIKPSSAYKNNFVEYERGKQIVEGCLSSFMLKDLISVIHRY